MPDPLKQVLRLDEDEERELPCTDDAIAELLEDVEIAYFLDRFDAIAYETNKMVGDEFEIDEIERERFKLKKQLHIIVKKISSFVMANDNFSNHVNNYSRLKEDVARVLKSIFTLRESLAQERSKCTDHIKVQQTINKQNRVKFIRTELLTIRSFYQPKLKFDVEDDQFLRSSIDLFNKTREYWKYTCIRDFSNKILANLASMEGRISNMLAEQIVCFSEENYNLVYAAYKLLNKQEDAAKKIHECFHATICESSHSLILQLISNMDIEQKIPTQLTSLSYEELCKLAQPEDAFNLLIKLRKILFAIFRTYHHILSFHIKDDQQTLSMSESEIMPSNIFNDDEPLIIERGAIQKSMTLNLSTIFAIAAYNYNVLLDALDLSALKFECILQVVETTDGFQRLGQKHFGIHRSDIINTLCNKIRSYFMRYHMERMDELRMFLDNETFTHCPLSENFTAYDLSEFQFMRKELLSNGLAQLNMSNELKESDEYEYTLITDEDIFSSDFIVDADIKTYQEATEEIIRPEATELINTNGLNGCEVGKSTFNVCNTSLNLLRFIARYIHMARLLPSMAEQAIKAIIELYKYFIFVIFIKFCSDQSPEQQEKRTGIFLTSHRLRSFIDLLKKSSLKSYTNGALNDYNETLVVTNKMEYSFEPQDDSLSLSQRIVAVESINFLAKQLELLKPLLQLLTHKRRIKELDDFYAIVVPLSKDIPDAVFGCLALKTLEPSILKQVLGTNWDCKELQTKHSTYIDNIISRYSSILNQLKIVNDDHYIPQQFRTSIWSSFLLCTFRMLVIGFAEASKTCSSEGRGLMLLDFKSLTNELEAITSLRPLPHHQYLENYIKAFFLPATDLEAWISAHPEYSLSTLSALLNYNLSPSKRVKSRILSMLEY